MVSPVGGGSPHYTGQSEGGLTIQEVDKIIAQVEQMLSEDLGASSITAPQYKLLEESLERIRLEVNAKAISPSEAEQKIEQLINQLQNEKNPGQPSNQDIGKLIEMIMKLLAVLEKKKDVSKEDVDRILKEWKTVEGLYQAGKLDNSEMLDEIIEIQHQILYVESHHPPPSDKAIYALFNKIWDALDKIDPFYALGVLTEMGTIEIEWQTGKISNTRADEDLKALLKAVEKMEHL